MTLPVWKNGVSIYTIVYRCDDAKQHFTKWLSTSRSIQAKIEENRLHIYDHNTLSLFVLNWPFSWDNILIWDCYAKRHVYF